ncbi:hypothetical protein [Algoriphagus sp.]|jgi:hypothetical protein|uniref:hypothetical protein n=1 Tax=Algoriphagus sp. TaxID=1872435 RepID=UPI0027166D34|nr:hypothetical protein [Algoriphagus sp.]MDO8966352.1 hypothetical protein [Algoriphagus sp.]MDP3202299.1 hypothetical protein [Algoriphagus sp.]
MKILVFLAIFLVSSLVGLAQVSPKVQDTLYLNLYQGEETYSLIKGDDEAVKHGKYSFESTPAFNLDYTGINHLIVSGRYEKGRYQGIWEYKVGEYNIHLKGIQDSRQLNMDVALNGVERSIQLNYQNGIPQGIWKIINTPIAENRRQKEVQAGSFLFENGLAIGEFYFRGYYQDLLIKGNLNKEGFLDGILILEYVADEEKIREVRTYQNGFLIEIVRYGGSNFEDLIERVSYEEVSDRLKNGEGEVANGVKYSIGEKGFGLLFQNGYSSDHRKLTIQTQGNLFLEDFIGRFQRFGRNNSTERAEPIFNFTRRFKYQYPAEEVLVLKELYSLLIGINNELSEVLADPRVLLYKDNDDELSYSTGYLTHANRKVTILIEIIELLNSDFFEFANRENYFKEGILGLQSADTFQYEANKIVKEADFNLGVKIKSSENLIGQIESYIEILKEEVRNQLQVIGSKTRIYDNQSQIDSIESGVYLKENKVDALYGYFQRLPDEVDKKNLPLHYRIYKSFKDGLLKDLRAEYIAEEGDEKKITLGNSYIKWLDEFETSFLRMKKLDGFEPRVDGYFTRTSPNPFFDRDIETKIFPQIYGKSVTILLPAYLRSLVSSKRPEDMIYNLEKIEKLENRLIQLSEMTDDPEVVGIDRALRRENYDQRIERILQLQ